MTNVLLGGGSAVYTVDQVATVAEDVMRSFEAGTPSAFAQQHLFADSSCN